MVRTALGRGLRLVRLCWRWSKATEREREMGGDGADDAKSGSEAGASVLALVQGYSFGQDSD